MSYEQAYDKQQTDAPALLKVKIFSEFKTFFEGQAASVSSVNNTGPFDILPGHANFISLLQPGTVQTQRPTGEAIATPVERGILHVDSDSVTIFLDV